MARPAIGRSVRARLPAAPLASPTRAPARGREAVARAVAPAGEGGRPDGAVKAGAKAVAKAGRRAAVAAPAGLAAQAGLALPAWAKGGDFGLLEGRTAALVHPAMEFSLLACMAYAMYSGLQWRRTRTLGAEISALKKKLPAKDEEGNLPAGGAALVAEIATLTAERKELTQAGFRDKHTTLGSFILALGVTTSLEGGLNTYMRVGKLFPGPHLFAGAGMTALWAIGASLVPEMQKGNETARSAHIAINTVVLGLFLWQVPTGLEIVGKVFQFTSWP